MELRGVSCLELEELAPDKQQIMSSRSFGAYVYTLAELEEAVSTYIARAAEKLRRQHSVAGARAGVHPHQPVQARSIRSTSAASPCRCPRPPAIPRASPAPRCGA